jgi:deoxyribonuclease-4
MPAWLSKMGLDAYEYQCNRGVNIGKDMANKIGEEAEKNNIFMSIHAPYYINMASPEEEKRIKSKGYIIECMTVAKWMGAKRIVVHTGSYSKVDKKWALETSARLFGEVLKEADSLGLGDIMICPEVLGKNNQIGSLDEIIEMCRTNERLSPTIDFAHIHARGQGSLNSVEDFERVINMLENSLGTDRVRELHCHFSRVEFTKGGEKKHWNIDDTQFGPEFEYLAEVIIKKKINPVIICESRANMAEDALKLKKIYNKMVKGM